jgi:hypothetical protein
LKYLLDPQKNLKERRKKTREVDKIRKAQDDILHRKQRITDTTYKIPDDINDGRKHRG